MNNGNQSRFFTVECARGNSNGKIVRHRVVWLAMKFVVALFCMAKDHEAMKAQSVWSENTMQFLHHHQLATRLLPHSHTLLVV